MKNERQQVWHAQAPRQILSSFKVQQEKGLNLKQVRQKQREYGTNRLQEVKERNFWKILFSQFHNIVIYLLLASAILAFLTYHFPEVIVILVVVFVNISIGFFSEWKAAQSILKLKELEAHHTKVRREGKEEEIDASELVPGDIVILKEDDLIPADIRILKLEHFRVNEAPLTGEFVPSDKTLEKIEENIPLGETKLVIGS